MLNKIGFINDYKIIWLFRTIIYQYNFYFKGINIFKINFFFEKFRFVKKKLNKIDFMYYSKKQIYYLW